MEEVMGKFDLKNIDKSDWKTFRFDQIAEKISETVDPGKTDLDVYVGLEHLDPESIHIRRRGAPSDVSGGKLKCYPGDVIFGKRRAYQRKAAIVDFEGICSAHAFVLRAIPTVIDPKLFPFFLHSDLFMHCAVDISVGGLSPTINWGQLKEQEFLLPPKDQQAHLAELLWALDEVMEREREVLDKINELKYQACLDSFFNGKKVNRVEAIVLPNSQWKLMPLNHAVPDIEYGISISIPNGQNQSGIPIISTAEIDREGNLNYSLIRRIQYGKLNERLTLKTGDVLFNWRNTAELIGKSAIFIQPENDKNAYTFASFLLRMRCDNQTMINIYLVQLLNFYRINEIFLGLARKAVNQANFNKNEIGELLIPVPPYQEQKEIVRKLVAIENIKMEMKQKISNSLFLRKSLINQIF